MPDILPIGISLGSNQGNRVELLRSALQWLSSLSTTPILASSIYETQPIDCAPGTNTFLNAACEITYAGDILRLLRDMREFERQHGRPESYPKHAPRPLDLDMLYAGSLVQHTEELHLPHPRMLERRFVLQPLVDIRPDLVIPGSTQTIRSILASLPDLGDVKLYAEPLK
jgi:2-amino-4-hydroxy-6-hydroxymethyldihydropteridine diphosphokinase